MDYISAEKKDVICKKIKANCCKSVLYTKNAKRADYDKVTMSMPDTYSASLCSFTGDESGAIAACKQSCNLNDKCQAIVYNKTMGRCDIYDKPLITKPGFLKNDTDAETIQYQRANINLPPTKEGFQTSVDVDAGVGADTTANYCYSEGVGELASGDKSCYKKNGIVSDCRTQFDKCITRDIPGLSMTKKKTKGLPNIKEISQWMVRITGYLLGLKRERVASSWAWQYHPKKTISQNKPLKKLVLQTKICPFKLI
jgi:hypothetical protein